MRLSVLILAVLMLPGCIARTVANVATAPVKAGAKAADWATTSQDEADRNRGRELRKEEERRHKECKKAGGEDC